MKTVSHVCGLSPVLSSCDSHRPTTSMKQSFATLWQLRDTSSLMCYYAPRKRERYVTVHTVLVWECACVHVHECQN